MAHLPQVHHSLLVLSMKCNKTSDNQSKNIIRFIGILNIIKVKIYKH